MVNKTIAEVFFFCIFFENLCLYVPLNLLSHINFITVLI